MTARRRLVRPTGLLADQKADRDQLAATIREAFSASFQPTGTTLRRVADRILNSDWLAAHDAAVTAAALAPTHALADEFEADPRTMLLPVVTADRIRAAIGDPAAVATHNATERVDEAHKIGAAIKRLAPHGIDAVIQLADDLIRADTLTAHTGDNQ